MATEEKVVVRGEDRASREFDKASGGFERMGDTLKRVATVGGIAIAAKKVADLTGTVLNMAVDAGEAQAAFEQSFGQALPEASRFVDEFANKAGFATYELQQMLAITGSVVQGIGATEQESAALSERMAILAGDVASFTNATGGAQAVLGALQSAINGEREALKTYGLAIAETEVQQRALLITGKSRADELTRLEKAEATVTLAYEKAGKAVGDLDRTQDSAANTLRRLGARLKEAGVEAGERLLPALEALLPKIEDSIPALTDAAVALAGFIAAAASSAPVAHLATVIDGLSIAANSFIHVGAGLGTILGEIFTLGHLDTTGLQETAKLAANANDIRSAVRALRDEHVPGANAATQYGNALAQVQRDSFISEDAIHRLGAASGATAQEQLTAIETLRAYGEAHGFTTAEIDALTARERELHDELGHLPPTVDGIAQALLNAGGAAATAAGDIGELPQEIPAAVGAIEDLKKAAEEGAAAFREDLAEEAQSFITGFEKLPDRVDTTMSEFEQNLTDRIATQTAFWEGLATLAESGFGHLAEEIRGQGPEAAGLLEDMVGDMERAAALDDMLAQADGDMADLTGEYATALEKYGDPTLTALGQYGRDIIRAIAEGIQSGDLAGPLLTKVRTSVESVTGRFIPPTRDAGATTPRGRVYQEGTWMVPGRGAVDAIVHGGETIFGAPGTSGRATMVHELASELARVLGGNTKPSVHVSISELNVVVPPGVTTQEAVTAATTQAALEAILS